MGPAVNPSALCTENLSWEKWRSLAVHGSFQLDLGLDSDSAKSVSGRFQKHAHGPIHEKQKEQGREEPHIWRPLLVFVDLFGRVSPFQRLAHVEALPRHRMFLGRAFAEAPQIPIGSRQEALHQLASSGLAPDASRLAARALPGSTTLIASAERHSQ